MERTVPLLVAVPTHPDISLSIIHRARRACLSARANTGGDPRGRRPPCPVLFLVPLAVERRAAVPEPAEPLEVALAAVLTNLRTQSTSEVSRRRAENDKASRRW